MKPSVQTKTNDAAPVKVSNQVYSTILPGSVFNTHMHPLLVKPISISQPQNAVKAISNVPKSNQPPRTKKGLTCEFQLPNNTRTIKVSIPESAMAEERGCGSCLDFPDYLSQQYTALIDVEGDGHCGFRAIALGLNLSGSTEPHSYGSLRLSAIKHMLAHPNDFCSMFIEMEALEDAQMMGDIDSVLTQLNKFESPVWARDNWFVGMTHGLLLADVLERPICITLNGDDRVIGYTLLPFTKFNPKNGPIFIHFMGMSKTEDGHYHLGIPVDNCKMPPVIGKWKAEAVLKAEKFFADRFDSASSSNSTQTFLSKLKRSMEDAALAKVEKALNSKGEVIISKFRRDIKSEDICRLKAGFWLNDEIVNFYGFMIQERSKQNGTKLPKIWIFNSFFYGNLKTRVITKCSAGQFHCWRTCQCTTWFCFLYT